MEDTQSETPPNELEIIQVFGIDTGCRIDLKRVVVMGRVFEQTVERVEHLVGEQEASQSRGWQAVT